MSKTSTERLLERLKDQPVSLDFDALSSLKVERTYAGYWQRAQGAWSWQLGSAAIGSQYSLTDLFKCKHEWQFDSHPFTQDLTISPCAQCE